MGRQTGGLRVLFMRSAAAMLMASASIGSGVWLHGYRQTNPVGAAGFASLLSRSSLGSLLGTGKHKPSLAAVLNARHGRLARLRAQLGLGRFHPKWASPAALVVIIGGVGMSVLTVFRGFMMRRRARRFAQGAMPPELLRMFGQFGRGSDQ